MMIMKNDLRPKKIDSLDSLNNYYWLKKELLTFCKNNKLSSQGSKQEITQRINDFFMGVVVDITSKKKKTIGKPDSNAEITVDTPVINYKNDVKTREFFIGQIGEQFKFNSYLRQFTNKKNILPDMTYADLVDGWILFEKDRHENKETHPISEQFEYNRFIKDFFVSEVNSTLKGAIEAWNKLKSLRGDNTYQAYKKL